MGTDQLTLVVIGKNQQALDSFDKTHVDCNLVLLANPACVPLSKLANEQLQKCQTLVFGLSHADVWYHEGALEAFFQEAANGNVCGLVGAHQDKRYRCCTDMTPTPERASTLDGMGIFFRTDLGLQFDEKLFDGMHCHVEDLCLQAASRLISITVPAANAHHINHAQTKGWLEDYWYFRRRLAQKWIGHDFVTT
jgi:hypothetical protein